VPGAATLHEQTAELRVPRFLKTHLSIAEIGDRLVVSRNTVTTQAVSIDRKLGTNSRRAAVAVAAGLLDPHAAAT
jgi:LuxR family transcriptional regulator, maltose regulon positive regulatory protein